MIRIERTRDGELRVWILDKPVNLPAPGSAIVATPETVYKFRIENSKDVHS